MTPAETILAMIDQLHTQIQIALWVAGGAAVISILAMVMLLVWMYARKHHK